MADTSRQGTGDKEFVVSVSSDGQIPIPESIRKQVGIDVPGRVRFVTREDGQVYLKTARSISDFRGIGSSEKSSSELVKESREYESKRYTDMVERLGCDVDKE